MSKKKEKTIFDTVDEDKSPSLSKDDDKKEESKGEDIADEIFNAMSKKVGQQDGQKFIDVSQKFIDKVMKGMTKDEKAEFVMAIYRSVKTVRIDADLKTYIKERKEKVMEDLDENTKALMKKGTAAQRQREKDQPHLKKLLDSMHSLGYASKGISWGSICSTPLFVKLADKIQGELKYVNCSFAQFLYAKGFASATLQAPYYKNYRGRIIIALEVVKSLHENKMLERFEAFRKLGNGKTVWSAHYSLNAKGLKFMKGLPKIEEVYQQGGYDDLTISGLRKMSENGQYNTKAGLYKLMVTEGKFVTPTVLFMPRDLRLAKRSPEEYKRRVGNMNTFIQSIFKAWAEIFDEEEVMWSNLDEDKKQIALNKFGEMRTTLRSISSETIEKNGGAISPLHDEMGEDSKYEL